MTDDELVRTCLSPGQQQRFDRYISQRHGLEGVSGDFVFDCDQHLEAGRTGSDLWPCLLTHGCVVSAPRDGSSA